MPYYLNKDQLKRFEDGLMAAISIPFIDDIEDYVVEALLAYAKDIDNDDPFSNTRSKLLYDIVDNSSSIGYSVKSLKCSFRNIANKEFEHVIQRSDIFDKAKDLGFDELNLNSDAQILGAALLKNWKKKVNGDAKTQNVSSKRKFVLLKSTDNLHYAIFEDVIHLYRPEELKWQWTKNQKDSKKKKGLQGIRKKDNMCVYRWYSNQKQLFERFKVPKKIQILEISPRRLEKKEVVNLLLSYMRDNP